MHILVMCGFWILQPDTYVFEQGLLHNLRADGGNVVMENGAACKVIEIGSIKVRRHDGSLCTVNDVRHVPGMKKNLIFLSLLHSKSFSFKGKGGVVFVCKGLRKVLKGMERGTLYALQGNVLSGSTAVASSLVHQEDMTTVWNMRLGHMSERGDASSVKEGSSLRALCVWEATSQIRVSIGRRGY
ncbi:unnamed protein product [Linum trigynum]|uniref:Retrovirus-related Pol polyprotein from transposon TNT 1-94-like beta-barrel domain-containing protein n=1 Tax=Linum trigynum TaxID=586398 RepID=A0AAV2F5W3_9ROSI